MSLNAIVTVRAVAAVLAVVSFAAAALMLFLPLPAQDLGLDDLLWCGPGATSDSALRIALHPDDVNISTTGQNPNPAQAQTNKEVYSSAASGRFIWAIVLIAAGVALLVIVPIFVRPRPTWPPSSKHGPTYGA